MAFLDWFKNITGRPNALDQQIVKLLANSALYPEVSTETYLESYISNNDVFTVINKITEPASIVPVFQYDANGEIVENGKMIARLQNPNPWMNQSQFIEACMTFYYIFGNSFVASESLDNGLNAGQPLRLDVLPPQWMQINIGTVLNPVKDYSFYNSVTTSVPYTVDKVFHWKEFNPDFDYNGGHLKGMSRLRPLLKSITGSQSGYDSLVKAFQNQGAWGILTILGEDGKGIGSNLSKEQASQMKSSFKRDSKKGELTVTGKDTKFTNFGLSVVDLSILQAIGTFKGNLCDAYNFPDILLSGSNSKTYTNFKEAERSKWENAICPTLDAFLEGLTRFLAPKFKEDGQVLKADYSGVQVLQTNNVELVQWMMAAKAFTKNEIREALGYEELPDPAMDIIYGSAGDVPLSEISNPPDAEAALKALKLRDYRV